MSLRLFKDTFSIVNAIQHWIRWISTKIIFKERIRLRNSIKSLSGWILAKTGAGISQIFV
jgi:hypothetical protein